MQSAPEEVRLVAHSLEVLALADLRRGHYRSPVHLLGLSIISISEARTDTTVAERETAGAETEVERHGFLPLRAFLLQLES